MDTTSFSLLDRLRRPQPDGAWETFVQLYTPLLFVWARQLHRSDADAADLVQEVFAVLVRRLPEFEYDPRRSFRAWLKTVAVNKYRELARRAAPATQAPDGLLDEQPASADEGFWERDYRAHLTQRALDVMRTEFQPATWQAFWALVVEEHAGAEVAAALGLSINAVYVARSRVLRRLRQELEGLM
jgi:RNA polymerase sigma-70 factor (ECF subfamily)